MKQFLVPALLLALVGTAAALAVNSTPAAPAAAHHEPTAMPAVCPVSAGHHDGAAAECSEAAAECTPEMAEKCTPEKAENCPMGEMSEECKKRCEDKPDLDCCKKKLGCGNCKKDEKPVEKP